MGRIRFVALPLRGLFALILAFALLLLGLSGALLDRSTPASGSAASPHGPRVGDAAPDFTLYDVDGKPATLSALRGRPVVLFFWAGWCASCLAAFPELSALAASYNDAGLTVLAVNIMQPAADVAALRAEHGLDLPLLLDADAAVTNLYGVRVTPAFFFIGRDGKVWHRIGGTPRPGQLAGAAARIVRAGGAA